MSHTVKLWGKIIKKSIEKDTIIIKEEFGFMPRTSTTDAIIVLRQLLEKHREKRMGVQSSLSI